MGAKLKWLHTIIDLVDKDVADNSKPVSLIAAALPFLPFMIFVDGAPADSHPVLAGLAFAVSLSWIAFVLWRMFRHTRVKLEGYGYQVGSARFWRLFLGTLLLITAITLMLTWFQNHIG